MGKGRSEDTKGAVLSYFANSTLIQLTRSGTLSEWTKFEGFLGFVVENNSWWCMAGSNSVRPWPNKALFSLMIDTMGDKILL